MHNNPSGCGIQRFLYSFEELAGADCSRRDKIRIQKKEEKSSSLSVEGKINLMSQNLNTGAASGLSSNDVSFERFGNIRVLFIAGFGPIVRDAVASRKFYGQNLGIDFKEESGGYLHTEGLKGAKTFAVWPVSQAAQSCFGKDCWPEEIPVPQAWLEFDVDSVEKATAELESQGHQMLVKNKKEAWGQTVSRFLSPEGMLVGITFTPSMREGK